MIFCKGTGHPAICSIGSRPLVGKREDSRYLADYTMKEKPALHLVLRLRRRMQIVHIVKIGKTATLDIKCHGIIKHAGNSS